MQIILKEWRRLLRTSATPWALAAYVLIPAAVAAVYLKVSSGGLTGLLPQLVPLLGAQALSNLGAWQILLLAVWVPWQAGTMLAAEVEERTLDPLLAGGGRLFGVVAGKYLAAVSFFALVMLAGLPAFALPMLVGGINLALIGRVAALEGATVVLMAGLGMLLSGFGRRAGSAALAGVALGLMLTLGSGLAAGFGGTGGAGVDPRILMMKGGVMMGGGPAQTATGAKWLYANPLTGLISALDNGAPALIAIPGTWTGTVYREYSLWQLQIAGAACIGLFALVLAWLVMSVRLRWRRPLWLLKFRRRKAVALHG